MFKKIREILSPKQPTHNPYNLKDSELAALTELRSHPHWKYYIHLLDTLTTFLHEDMLASEDANLPFYRAQILGVRRAGTIVDELIQQEKAKDARTRERSNTDGRDESRKLAAFGTPYWNG